LIKGVFQIARKKKKKKKKKILNKPSKVSPFSSTTNGKRRMTIKRGKGIDPN